MRCLIDKSVVNAEPYYRTYAREPSPAGDITISPTDLTAVSDLDLKTVLTEMKTLGAKGEMLVVTHSNPHGLKMPLVKGGNAAAAELKVMDILVKISSGIARREAIRSMPADKKPKAWQAWFKDFDPGVKIEDGFETSPNWETEIEKLYQDWYERQGKQILKLPSPKQDLADLIALLDAVRKTGFARLEFRACRIGTDKDALKAVGEFFNAKKVVAPKEVRTFFGHISGVTILTDAEFAKKAKAGNARTFPNIKVLFLTTETTFQAFATSEAEVRTFIKTFVSSGYTGAIKPFVMGGLEPVGKAIIPGKKHVFPLESEYLSLLDSFDAPQAAAASGGVP
jgi:hypothetical protein